MTGAQTNTILEIKDLVCGYDSFQVEDITFKVEKAGFIGIIGPNGSGKTSLLRAITRILKPKQGTIYLEGENIRHMGVKEIAKKISEKLSSSRLLR